MKGCIMKIIDKYELCNESRGLLEDLQSKLVLDINSANWEQIHDSYPSPRRLNTEERREMLEKTFALGKKVYRKNNEQFLMKTIFSQNSHQRYIKIDPAITKTIQDIEHIAKKLNCMYAGLDLKV